MKVSLQYALSDAQGEVGTAQHQRQLMTTIRVVPESTDTYQPLNLTVIVDRSASIAPATLDTLKQSLLQLAAQLTPQDYLTLVAFNHCAEVLVSHGQGDHWSAVRSALDCLEPQGGTCLSEALRLGLSEVMQHRNDRISQVLLISDGSNDHGSDDRCGKLAEFLGENHIGFQAIALGVGQGSQGLLADLVTLAQGKLTVVQHLDQLSPVLHQSFTQLQSVRCVNAVLYWVPEPTVRLAAHQPWAQVSPEVMDLDPKITSNRVKVTLGTVVNYSPRVLLANLYVAGITPGVQTLGRLQVQYRHPQGTEVLRSPTHSVSLTGLAQHQPSTSPEMRPHLLNLAKYRQVALAETGLEAGDLAGAAQMLYAAALTVQELGNPQAEQLLGHSADRLRGGGLLGEADRQLLRLLAQSVL